MLDNKFFWYGNMAGAVLGWLFVIYGFFFSLPSPMMRIAWILIFCAWTFGHTLELTKALPIAKDAKVPLNTAVLKTFVFGLTWWVPLERGVFEK